MRNAPLDYSEEIRNRYRFENKDISSCRNVTFVVTENCNAACTYCVSGDTLVRMADFSEKKISEIQVGDKILSFDEKPDRGLKSHKDRSKVAEVIETYKHTANNVLKITFTNGREIFITENHKILRRRNAYQNSDFVPSENLKVGQIAYGCTYESTSPPIKNDDYKIGYLVGILKGDGSIKSYKTKKWKCSNYKTRLALKDDEALSRAKEYLDYLGFNTYLKPFKISTKYNISKDAIFSNRKDTYYSLLELFSSNFRKNNTKEYYAGFLAGIFDAEGSFTNQILRICNTDWDIISEISDGLDALNIGYVVEENGRTINKPKKWNVRILHENKGREIVKFLSSTEPVITRKGLVNLIGTSFLQHDYCVKSVEKIEEPIDVYNIATSTHTYIANGLAVHNCYERCKSQKMMTFDTAKKIVDLVFKLSETDDSTFINTKTQAVILEFIGGEPLLNIDVIEKTCDYFWHKALELHHRYAENFRISMISNGILYFDERVQRFLKRFKDRLSFAITVDGDKEMHDSCRVRQDGSGTWEQANAAQMHYKEHFDSRLGTKVTIAPSNLEHLDRTIKYFIENGYTEINANPVFEEEWTVEQAKVYYKKLVAIADYIIDNNLQEKIYCSLFNKNHFRKIDERDQHPYCGGTGDMCAFGTEGTAYPCIRYMNMSLNGSQPEIVIGNCDSGIYQTDDEKAILRDMAAVTRRSSNDDECYYCPIASGCGNCSAWCYQKYGTYNKRDKGICWMHRARCLANDYFFKKIGEPFDMNLQKEFADQILE